MERTKKPPKGGFFSKQKLDQALLDLGFLKFDMLFGNRIIFLEGELFRLGAGVLLANVEIAGVSGRKQLDFNAGSLGHGSDPV
jgi:hypothetical protein